MSDQSNDQNDVLARHSAEMRMARENAELRARLSKFENNVTEGDFHRGEVPKYYLNDPIYLDDTYFDRGSSIETWETPSHTCWVPLNEPARVRVQEHLDLCTYGAQRKAAREGRAFTGLVNDRNVLLDEAFQDARAASPTPLVMPTKRDPRDIPPMPHTPEAQAAERRKPGRPRKVISVELPNSDSRLGGTELGAPKIIPGVVGRMSS
jgi:hypothetical protein